LSEENQNFSLKIFILPSLGLYRLGQQHHFSLTTHHLRSYRVSGSLALRSCTERVGG